MSVDISVTYNSYRPVPLTVGPVSAAFFEYIDSCHLSVLYFITNQPLGHI